jgi:hypothetical protein
MKNVASLLCLMLLSGCAFLSKDTLLEASSSQWKVGNYHGRQSLTYECADGQVYNLWIDRLLARKSKAYFIFFIVPVHFGEAEAIDNDYSGIRISAKLHDKSMKCSTNDMRIMAGTSEIYPNQALESNQVFALNNTYCDYLLDYPISVSGEFLLVLNDIQSCAVPSIKFEYETSTNYNYEHGPW